jgi:hypothetical protein
MTTDKIDPLALAATVEAGDDEWSARAAACIRALVAERDLVVRQNAGYQSRLLEVEANLTAERAMQSRLCEDIGRFKAERANAMDVLRDLAKACGPIDLWIGGIWAKSPSNDERHAFALGVSAAYALLEEQ